MIPRFHLLILGADNPIGRALTEQAQTKQIPFHAIHSTDWDLTDQTKLQARLADLSPTFLINCISPFEQGTTAQIANALGQVCVGLNIGLLQLSSNRVFSQQEGEVFKETDEPSPKTPEGKLALAVETAIKSVCPQHLILRVGWVFSSEGHDDVSKLLELAQNNNELYLSNTKPLCPTSACDIASVMLAMVSQTRFAPLWGTYHYCSAEQTTLFKFAEVVVAEARQYEDLKVHEMTVDASHHMNGLFSESSPKLNTRKILYTFGIKPKAWRQALSRILKKRYAGKNKKKTAS